MRLVPLVLLCAALPSGLALADGIDDMCLKSSGNDKAICDCARTSMEGQFRPEDMKLYEGATRRYAADTVSDGRKWERALQEAGTEQGVGRIDSTFRTNPIKSAHAAALRDCQTKLGAPSTRPAPPESAAAEAKPAEPDAKANADLPQDVAPDTPMEIIGDVTPQ